MKLLVVIFSLTIYIHSICGFPILQDNNAPDSLSAETHSFASSPLFFVLAIAVVVCGIVMLSMCTGCFDFLFAPKADTSDMSPRRHSMDPSAAHSTGHTPRASESDLTVTIEPLPDLAAAKTGKAYIKPMGYNQVVNKGPDVSDWFQGAIVPEFPRAQLQYVKELGNGWFGSVVQGEASKMTPQKRKMKVIVQILREDLTSMERAFILHTAKMFRDVTHENVLKIIGKCMDKQPYLLLYEHAQGNYLKSYLVASRGVSDDLLHNGTVLKICCDIADGLSALHRHGYVHNDLACRNCLFINDGAIKAKVGDYGTGFSIFKDEYVTVGDIAVPIRWVSPDSVEVAAGGQLLTKEITQVDNVWTLGVVLWEILEFGKLPYMELNDDGVVNKVLKTRSLYLQLPLIPLSQRERLYEIMRFCWLPANIRPSAEEIAALLKHLLQFRPNVDSSSDFDAKWNSLVAARRPALLASANSEQSYSPIPADPAIPQSYIPTIESKSIPPQTSPVEISNFNAKPTDLVNVVKVTTSANPDTLRMISPVSIVSPTVVPAMPPDDPERIEKRTFILTLSLADLAMMNSRDLTEFYEYLSKEEILDLEKRHALAMEEANEKRQKRETFLAMTLDEMEDLSVEDLGDYMRCLDETDKKETKEKLAKAAAEKKKIQTERNRILTLLDKEILDLKDNDFQGMQGILSEAELESLKAKFRQLKINQERCQKAESMSHLGDRELAHVESLEISEYCQYLSADQSEILKKRHEKLMNMRKAITEATDNDLSQLKDGEFEHYASILDTSEADAIREKRKSILDKKRSVESKRKEIFAMSLVDLANVSPEELEIFRQVLDQAEFESIDEKRMDALEARRTLFSMNIAELKGLSEEDFESYHRFLTMEEIEGLKKARNTVSPAEERSPSAQGSQLAAEALQLARDHLIELDNQDDQDLVIDSPKVASHGHTPKKQPVKRLTLSSVDLEDASHLVPASTPELRNEHHFKREMILTSDDETIRAMPQEQFEDYFQYLTPEEILNLEERRKKLANAVELERNITGNEGLFGQSSWETRDYVLHMSENQLADLHPNDMNKIAECFTSEEFDRIQRRWKEALDKRDFIKHSTDEELAGMATEKLEEYLSALPEQERAQIRDRVNAIQARWLPEALRSEEAFRDILRTVPSISQSESESYVGFHNVAPSVRERPDIVRGNGTPSSSVDEEDPEILVNLNGESVLNEQHGQRQFEDLFGPNTPMKESTGLKIPELRLQPATPIDGRSIGSDVEYVPITILSPLKFDTSGLVHDLSNTSTPRKGADTGLNEEEGETDRVNISTPFEAFAESMLDEMDVFGSLKADATAYVTAHSNLYGDTSAQLFDLETKEETASNHQENGVFQEMSQSTQSGPLDSMEKNKERAAGFYKHRKRSRSRSPKGSDDEQVSPGLRKENNGLLD